MGWIPDDEGLVGQHEGYVVYIARDGRTGSSTNSDGFVVRRQDADEQIRKARRTGAEVDPLDLEEVIPWREVDAWQAACTCGWTGATWSRWKTTPDRYDGTDPNDAIIRAGLTVDELLEESWLNHIAPLESLGHVRVAAAALASARRQLDEAVAAARAMTPPVSWGKIGEVTNLTRQAARQRWGDSETCILAPAASRDA